MNIPQIKRPWNTKQRGIIEFLYFREKNQYIGVCLTFNIVEEGEDSEVLRKSLNEAATLHLKVVIKKNLSDKLLNRYAPTKYWEKYFDLQKRLAKERTEAIRQRTTSTTANTRYTINDFLSPRRSLVHS